MRTLINKGSPWRSPHLPGTLYLVDCLYSCTSKIPDDKLSTWNMKSSGCFKISCCKHQGRRELTTLVAFFPNAWMSHRQLLWFLVPKYLYHVGHFKGFGLEDRDSTFLQLMSKLIFIISPWGFFFFNSKIIYCSCLKWGGGQERREGGRRKKQREREKEESFSSSLNACNRQGWVSAKPDNPNLPPEDPAFPDPSRAAFQVCIRRKLELRAQLGLKPGWCDECTQPKRSLSQRFGLFK